MKYLAALLSAVFFLSSVVLAQQKTKYSEKDFERMLKERYEKQLVQILVEGLYASAKLSVRDDYIVYAHYPEALPTQNHRVLSLNSQGDSPIDRMPFRGGSNPADLKFVGGDPDTKTLVQASFTGLQTFLLQPNSTMRIAAIKVNKRKIRLTLEAISPAYGALKPGVDFDFHFDEDKVLKAGDYDVVVSEISKFFGLRN